jgi:copper chaperone
MKKLISLTILFSFISLIALASSKQATFEVKGDCMGCKVKIEDALDIKGVTYANWNFDTNILVVKYNESKIELDTIREIVEELGYEVTQKSPPPKKEKTE